MIFEKYDLVVIGAGVCGLTIGYSLTSSSVNFKVFEKSRAYGGRAATRRIHGQPVDHGTQYFTVKDSEFKKFVREYQELGIVKNWTNKFNVWDGKTLLFESEATDRYICPEGFTAISKEMAKVIPVSREIKITEAKLEGEVWQLQTDANVEIEAKKVISTAPLQQSLELFGDYLTEKEIGKDNFQKLNEVQFDPCLSVILVYELSDHIPWKGVFWNSGNILSWVSHDSSKRSSPSHTVIVAQCSGDFSRKNFDSSEDKILKSVTDELSQLLPSWVKEPKEAQVKKWRYSKPTVIFGEPYLSAQDDKLVLTGDWCLGSKIEDAFLSAKACLG